MATSERTTYSILVLPGDGIGPEIITEALKVLQVFASSSSSVSNAPEFKLRTELIGGSSIDAHGTSCTEAVKQAALQSDAVLFACVGGPKWDGVRRGLEGPEGGLLQLRRALDVYGNLRPCVSPCKAITREYSPYKYEVTEGVEFVVLRENCGGAYFGRKVEEDDYGECATDYYLPDMLFDWPAHPHAAMDEWAYSTPEIERITRLAGWIARRHNSTCSSPDQHWPIISLDKANVLASSRLWRRVVERTLKTEFPDVKFMHQLADSASLLMATNPRSLNGVLLADNTFGDMLSDQAGSIVGSLGVLPSASLSGIPGKNEDGKKAYALYEPTHGSAPT
jgi:3-isopropylmalate dehydrogenase